MSCDRTSGYDGSARYHSSAALANHDMSVDECEVLSLPDTAYVPLLCAPNPVSVRTLLADGASFLTNTDALDAMPSQLELDSLRQW